MARRRHDVHAGHDASSMHVTGTEVRHLVICFCTRQSGGGWSWSLFNLFTAVGVSFA
jgi:hypothetical protein